MDSDHSSASAFDVMDADQECLDFEFGNVCCCGRRMSSLNYDHHSICSYCQGFECTHDNRCEECLLISDVQFAAYFKHQKSLKRKLLSKQRSKSKLCFVDSPLPPTIDPAATISPSSVVCEDNNGGSSGVSPAAGHSSSVTLDQLRDLLGNFTKSLGSKCADINNRIDSISQDVHNFFYSFLSCSRAC